MTHYTMVVILRRTKTLRQEMYHFSAQEYRLISR